MSNQEVEFEVKNFEGKTVDKGVATFSDTIAIGGLLITIGGTNGSSFIGGAEVKDRILVNAEDYASIFDFAATRFNHNFAALIVAKIFTLL